MVAGIIDEEIVMKKSNLFFLAIFIIAVVFPLLLIWIMAYQIPFGDTWDDSIVLYFSYLHHTLTWQYWVHPHNEHRVILTRAITLFKDIFFPTSRYFIQLTSYFLFLATYFLLVFQFEKARFKLQYSEKSYRWFYLLTAGILFFPKDISFWRWGFIIQFPLTVFFVTATIFCLSQKNITWLRYGCAILLSLLATASSANGLMIWPIGFLLLILCRSSIMKMAAYVIIGLIIIYFYSHDNHLQGFIINEPIKSFLYFTDFLGNWSTALLASVIGCAVLVLFFNGIKLFFNRYHVEKITIFYPWLALGLFAIANGFVAALTRIQFGVGQSLSIRYAAISLMLCASLTGFYALQWSRLSDRYKKILKFFVFLFIVFFVGSYHRVFFQLTKNYRFIAQEIALPYGVLLPTDNGSYSAGNDKIADRLLLYRQSALYTLSNPEPHYLNQTLSETMIKKIGVTVDPKNYSITIGKRSLKNYVGFISGVALSGSIHAKNNHANLSASLLLLNADHKIIGIAFIAHQQFFGFMVGAQPVNQLIQLKKGYGIRQDRTRTI